MRRRIACVLAAAVMLSSMPLNAITSYAQEAQVIEEIGDVATSSDAEEENEVLLDEIQTEEKVIVEEESDGEILENEEIKVDIEENYEAEELIDISTCSLSVDSTVWFDSDMYLSSKVTKTNGEEWMTVDSENYELVYSTSYDGEYTTELPNTNTELFVKARGKNQYTGITSACKTRYYDNYFLAGYNAITSPSSITSGEEFTIKISRYVNGTYETLDEENYSILGYISEDFYQKNMEDKDKILSELVQTVPTESGRYYCVIKANAPYYDSIYGYKTGFFRVIGNTSLEQYKLVAKKKYFWIDEGLDGLNENFSVVLKQGDEIVEVLEPEDYELSYSEDGFSDWKTGLPSELGRYYIKAVGKTPYTDATNFASWDYVVIGDKKQINYNTYGIRLDNSTIFPGQTLGVSVLQASNTYFDNIYLDPSNYKVQYVENSEYRNNNYSLDGLVLSDEMPNEVGEYLCVVTGIGEYSGQIFTSFTIQSACDLKLYEIYNSTQWTGYWPDDEKDISEYLSVNRKYDVDTTIVKEITSEHYQYMFLKENTLNWFSDAPRTSGKYYVKAVGINGYVGETKKISFEIKDNHDISDYDLYVRSYDILPTESMEIYPYRIMDGKKRILDESAYEIGYVSYESYQENQNSFEGLVLEKTQPTNLGSYVVVIKGIGDFYGTINRIIKIHGSNDLALYLFSMGRSEIWTDESIEDIKKFCNVRKKDGTNRLSTDDFDLMFRKYHASTEDEWIIGMPTEAGTYNVRVKGKGQYIGEVGTERYSSVEVHIGYDFSKSDFYRGYYVYNINPIWSDHMELFDDSIKVCHHSSSEEIENSERIPIASENYIMEFAYSDQDGNKYYSTERPKKAGSYEIRIKGVGDYTGEFIDDLEIRDQYSLEEYEVDNIQMRKGEKSTPNIWRMVGGNKEYLSSECNVTTSYYNSDTKETMNGLPTAPGEYWITVEGMEPYYGRISYYMYIYESYEFGYGYHIDCPDVYRVHKDDWELSVVESDTGKIIDEENYTLSYSNYYWSDDWKEGLPTETGSYTIRVQGNNKYKGSCYKEIEVINLSDDSVIHMTGTSMEIFGLTQQPVYVKIVPEETAQYDIYANSDCLKMALLDSDENILIDDIGDTEVKLNYEFEKGKVYYLRFRDCRTVQLVVKKSGTVDNNPHTHSPIVAPAIAPTCTTKGKTAGSRCVCGYVLEKQTDVAALGHAWKTMPATAATCTQAGISEGLVCERCGEIGKKQVEIPATGHTFGDYVQTVAPTAVAEGVNTHKCTACGVEETASIAKLTPTMKMNVTSITLKVKQSTKAVKVSGLAVGDRVQSWKSSNTKIVKVTNSGKITAGTKTGNATITVTLASGLSKKVKVKVQKKDVACTKVKLSDKKLTLKKGKNKKLVVTVQPITCIQKASFKTSNKKVATVDSKGKIVAKGKGKATITVTVGKKKATCKVTVK